MSQRTLVLVKPDGVARGLVGGHRAPDAKDQAVDGREIVPARAVLVDDPAIPQDLLEAHVLEPRVLVCDEDLRWGPRAPQNLPHALVGLHGGRQDLGVREARENVLDD